jgi:nitric oxide dioxygenase
MTLERAHLVRESWRQLAPTADLAAASFYCRLFELDPRTTALFEATDMEAQRKKFADTLSRIVRQLDSPEELIPNLAPLARRHIGYGVRASDYHTVGEALLWALERALGDAFTGEVRSAWAEAYALLAAVMLRAAAKPPAPV